MAFELIKISGFRQSHPGETAIDFLVPKDAIMNLVKVGDTQYAVNIKPEYLAGLGNIQRMIATISNADVL